MKNRERENPEVRVLLHNIRSTHNVGSIFRTADALGVSHVYLSGYTPRPLDKFGRPVKEIAKTALGAELSIPWSYSKIPKNIYQNLKREGFAIVGIEQGAKALDYKTYTPKEKTLLVVGNEVRGLSSALQNACDVLLEIPMRGQKESLNVSVAFGIAMFRIFDR